MYDSTPPFLHSRNLHLRIERSSMTRLVLGHEFAHLQMVFGFAKRSNRYLRSNTIRTPRKNVSASTSIATVHSISFWPDKPNITTTVVPAGKICAMTTNCTRGSQLTATRGSTPLSTTTRPNEFGLFTGTRTRRNLRMEQNGDMPCLANTHRIASEIPGWMER